jgi:hypothetical protein
MKEYAFYARGDNQEIADYHFMRLFFYLHDELQLDMHSATIFVDIGDTGKQKNELMKRLDEFKAIITPAYWHFMPDYEMYHDFYEKQFFEHGLYVICLDEEEEYQSAQL